MGASDSIVSGAQGAAVAWRGIAQEPLAIVGSQRCSAALPDAMSQLVDRTGIDRLLTGISAPTKGELGWRLLALFRALLLATWHDHSDGAWPRR